MQDALHSKATHMESVKLETSFISYLVAGPSRDLLVAAHQQVTHEWWANRRSQFKCSVSQVVIDERRRVTRRMRNNDSRSSVACRNWRLRRRLKHWQVPSWLPACFRRMLWLELDLTEVGVHGPAQVTAIEPCPEIEVGEGRLVTGTFHYSAGILCDLQIEGEEKALGVTGTHPFWSQHRQSGWMSPVGYGIPLYVAGGPTRGVLVSGGQQARLVSGVGNPGQWLVQGGVTGGPGSGLTSGVP